MSTGARIFFALLMLGGVASVHPDFVFAYGGPGSVLSGIGTLLAALAAIIASLFGFLWFPLKRLYRKFRGGEDAPVSAEAEASAE